MPMPRDKKYSAPKAVLKSQSGVTETTKRKAMPSAEKKMMFRIPQTQGSDVSVNVRQIEGGFLIREQSYDRKKKRWAEKEHFSKTKPKIEFK